MTFDRSQFSDYKPMQAVEVEMGTKAKTRVAGCGDVVLTLDVNGQTKPCKLKGVVHVPEFGYSLLSVSKMIANGLKVEFERDICEVKHSSKTVATAKLVDKLYVLDLARKTESAVVASLQIWHERLGHVHSQGIASMVRNNVVSEINLSKSDLHDTHKPKSDRDFVICTACVYGKATRSVIPRLRSSGRASRMLELVHSDICGPLQVQSIGGARYFITFIDDNSNWSVVYPMHKRSEAFHYYKLFAHYAQTHTGRKIKVLRSDRGGEYLSDEFQTHLDECGTQHQMTSAYTPEQNGVAERLNRTLMNVVRSMPAHKEIKKQFCAEALSTSVYVRDRVTSRVLPPNTTPHHKWMGKPPNLSYIRVFGSKCWYTLPKVKVKKLDPRARDALFLGYAESSKAYKLWDGELQKIVISRDVVFDEFGSGVCGNIGVGNILDTDVDLVSLDIESDNNPSGNAPSSETLESESEESNNSESADEEYHESPDSTSPNAETPPSPSDNSSESGKLPLNQVHSQEQPRSEPRRSGRVRNPVSQWWRAMYSAGITSHAHVVTNIPNSYKQAVNGPKVSF